MSPESLTAKEYHWHIYRLEGRDPDPETTEGITIYLAALRGGSTERAELEGRRYLTAWNAIHTNSAYKQALGVDSSNPLSETGIVEPRAGYDPIRNSHYFLFRVIENGITFMASQEAIPGAEECS